MREITSHVVEGDDKPQITITAADDPGPGGANHLYRIGGLTAQHPACAGPTESFFLHFQHGGVQDVGGWNGVSMEALLAICADRLEAFQAGPFPSQENATALHNVQEAMRSLHKRTQNRIKRGVEGTLQA